MGFTIPHNVWTIVPEASTVLCATCQVQLHPGEFCEHLRFAIENEQPMVFQNSGKTMVVRPG